MNVSAFSLLVFSSPSPTFSSLLLIVYLFGHVFFLPSSVSHQCLFTKLDFRFILYVYSFVHSFIQPKLFFFFFQIWWWGMGDEVKRWGLVVELWLSVKMKLFTSPSAFPMNGIFICFASSINNLEMWIGFEHKQFSVDLIIITVIYVSYIFSLFFLTSTKTFIRTCRA